MSGILAFCCYFTTYFKFGSLRQHPFIISHVCWLKVQYGMARLFTYLTKPKSRVGWALIRSPKGRTCVQIKSCFGLITLFLCCCSLLEATCLPFKGVFSIFEWGKEHQTTSCHKSHQLPLLSLRSPGHVLCSLG